MDGMKITTSSDLIFKDEFEIMKLFYESKASNSLFDRVHNTFF